MITLYEFIEQQQPIVMRTLKKVWGVIDFKPTNDPEDDPEFRYYDKLMRQIPRAR